MASSASCAATAGAIRSSAACSTLRVFRRGLPAPSSRCTSRTRTRSAWPCARHSSSSRRFPSSTKGLLFHGPYGVGKTHLAVGILKAVIRKTGAKGYFFETPELLRQVRNTYNAQVDETEMGVLKPILEADILVLDDLGTEKTSEWVQETLGLRHQLALQHAAADDSDEQPPRPDGERRSQFVHVSDRRANPLPAAGDVRVGGDPGARHPRSRRPYRRRAAGQWPTPPDNIKKGALPGKSRGQVRAQLRDKGAADLKWTGGKAGS